MHHSIPQLLAFVLCLCLLQACSDNSDTFVIRDPSLAIYNDPGTGPWAPVRTGAVATECGLDPAILAEIDASATYSYLVVRYGKLCHEFYHPNDPGQNELANNYSSTKTLAAALVGRAMLLSEDLSQPLSDTDRMDDWVENISFNQDALVAHVLAMIGFNDNLSYGARRWNYDANGSREINRLRDVVEAVMAQDPAQFSDARTAGEFAQREIFDRMGMRYSNWDGISFASSWHSNMRDMARLGLLLLNDGVWDQQRLIREDWVYKMTHAAFEDANAGYGYLTWTAADGNYYVPGLDVPLPVSLSDCMPPALWREYPHGLSESTDCNAGAQYSCQQTHDVGAFAALGAGGQNISVHRALQLVVVTRNAGNLAFINDGWDLMRSALIALDPAYAGDEDGFCSAYRAGEYAPDLITPP